MKRMACAAMLMAMASCAIVDERVGERQALAPGGTLRVALLEGNAVHFTGDPRSGTARGVGHDLGRALASDLGVPFEPVVYGNIAQLVDGAGIAQWDVAFLGITKDRAQIMVFAGSHLVLEYGYLVASHSAIRSIEDVARADVRVAVVEKGSPDVFLSANLHNAKFVRVPTLAAAVGLLRGGKVEVVGALKGALHDIVKRDPQAGRLLEGAPGHEIQALAVPRDRETGKAYAASFVERAKASGQVKAAIDRAGLQGVAVAP